MKSIFKLSCLLLLLTSFVGCSSYLKPISGNTGLGFLAGQEKVNVVFNYDNMGVNEFAEEEEYIEVSVNKRNKDEAGTGDVWKKKWMGQKIAVFEPNFIEGLNEKNEQGIYFSRDNKNAKYTLYLDVKYIQTGWNVGVMRKDAKVDIKAQFVETASLENSIDNSEALFTINDVPGRTYGGYDFAVSQRVGESFVLAGEELGAYISDLDF